MDERVLAAFHTQTLWFIADHPEDEIAAMVNRSLPGQLVPRMVAMGVDGNADAARK
jgi:hypothetical protein